jgi:hypothetical protein
MVIKHLHTTQQAGMADRKKHEELTVITMMQFGDVPINSLV